MVSNRFRVNPNTSSQSSQKYENGELRPVSKECRCCTPYVTLLQTLPPDPDIPVDYILRGHTCEFLAATA